MYPEFHLYITHQAVSLKLDRRTSLLNGLALRVIVIHVDQLLSYSYYSTVT